MCSFPPLNYIPLNSVVKRNMYDWPNKNQSLNLICMLKCNLRLIEWKKKKKWNAYTQCVYGIHAQTNIHNIQTHKSNVLIVELNSLVVQIALNISLD